MKPTRSRVICPDCGRMKTVFDSEKAALRFIEYNAHEIIKNRGYAPQRAYYCDLCCGWHVTSHKYHNYKTKNRSALDKCIEIERTKKEREEQIMLQQKKEQQELRRQQRKNNRKIIPSNSPVAPFLTLSMSQAIEAINKAKEQKFEEARELIEKAVCQLSRALNINGACRTKDCLNIYLNELYDIIHSETRPDVTLLDNIMLKFNDLIDLNESIFSYDPDAEGAHKFELTPDNYDEKIHEIEAREQETRERELLLINPQLEKLQDIEDKRAQSEELISLAYGEVVLGEVEDARKHLLNAILIIDSIEDSCYREMLTFDLKEVMGMLPNTE